MMGLPGAVVIDRLVVNHTPGGPIMFGGDDHPAEPRGGLVHWYSLQHSQTNISVKAVLHLLGPVYGDRGRGVNSYWCDSFDHEQPHRRAVLHQRKGLVFTGIEGTGSIPV